MNVEEAEGLSDEKLAELLGAEVKAKRAALVEQLAQSKKKAVARAAKKALYQLKSSGVAVAEPAAPKGAQPTVARDPEELPALMSTVLGTGERALFFVRARSGGGLDMYQAIVHDEHGVVQLDKGDTKRSMYRKHLEQVRAQQPSVLDVPLQRVLEELGVAWAVSARGRTPLSAEAESYLRRLGVTPIEKWPDLPAVEEGDAALSARGAQLHDEVEVAQWLPGAKQIQMLSQRLDEVDASLLQLTEPQKQEQRLQKVALTASEMTPEQRRLYAHRLWRTAEIFERTGRTVKAQIARAEARVLFHDPKAVSKFLERLFEKVVELAQRARAQQQGQQQEAPPVEKTSAGGLILP